MSQIFPYLLAVVIGLIGGVLVNYIVEWYYLRRNFLEPECAEEIRAKGLVKFVLWPWNFNACGKYKKLRLFIVDILFILIAIWLWFFTPPAVEFWWAFGLLLYFVIVIIMDLEYRVVLHPISIAGAIIGLAFGIYYHGDIQTPILGGVVGFVIMYIFYKFGELFIRRMNKQRGLDPDEVALGFGDVNIAGVIGLMLGFPGIIVGLFVAIILGGAVSLLYIFIMFLLRKLRAFDAIPYAPFIVLAAFLILYFRDFMSAFFLPN